MDNILNWLGQNVTLANTTLWAALVVLVLIAGAIIRAMAQPSFKMEYLLSEGTDGGKPSASRLQMLLWNFVVAFAFLYVLASVNGIEKISKLLTKEVMGLLVISNGTYYLAKRNAPGPSDAQGNQTPQTPPAAASRAGQPLAAGESHTGPGPQGTQ
jgi:hypothetical protein